MLLTTCGKQNNALTKDVHRLRPQTSSPEPVNMLFHYKSVIKVASPSDCKMDYPRLLSGPKVITGGFNPGKGRQKKRVREEM